MKNEQIMRAQLGKPIEIELKFPGASGYQWEAYYDGSRVTLLGKRSKINQKRMGAKAKQIFRFQALAEGDHPIHFALRRPWEENPVEQRDLILHVEIIEEEESGSNGVEQTPRK